MSHGRDRPILNTGTLERGKQWFEPLGVFIENGKIDRNHLTPSEQ
jgi:hypothetical protein